MVVFFFILLYCFRASTRIAARGFPLCFFVKRFTKSLHSAILSWEPTVFKGGTLQSGATLLEPPSLVKILLVNTIKTVLHDFTSTFSILKTRTILYKRLVIPDQFK